MNTVKELLDVKGHKLWSVLPTHSVFEAVEIKAEHDVGALPVLDQAGQLVGIISERDYARKVILKNLSPHEAKVADIMTSNVITVYEETPLTSCRVLMEENYIRHLPVLKGETVIGIISVSDLLRDIIEDQSKTIEELESAIFEETGGEG